MKLYTKNKINQKREILLLNKAIFSYGQIINDAEEEKFFKVLPKSFENEVYDSILSQIPNHHDLVIFARAGMGETYLLNFMIDELLKKFKASSPCFICHKKNYGEIFKLFNPTIPFYHIDIGSNDYFNVLVHRVKKYKGVSFNINPFPLIYLQNLLCEYENNERKSTHYVDIIKKINNIKVFSHKDFNFANLSIKDICKKISIKNLDNFIFVVPTANFLTPIENTFWSNILLELKNKGYDCYVNDEILSISEAVYLASFSKGIIGLRCGFTELLSQFSTPKHILYSNCKWNRIRQLHQFLTLSKYPFVDRSTLFEYDINTENLELIKEHILEEF